MRLDKSIYNTIDFCGVYRDGDDECTEYSSYEEIPEEIVEHFDIEDWSEEEDEDE